MAVSLSMPQFGQSVVEGTVSAWLKAEGDVVARDESLLTVSTDKIDTDLPAPTAGTLLRICVEPGATVAVGTVLAYIGAPGDPLPPRAAAPENASPPSAPTADAKPARQRTAAPGFLSPVVARMAQEHGLDLTRIAGTGRNGRITKKDVQAVIAQRRPPAPQLQPLTPMRRAIAEHMTRSVHTSPHVTSFFEADMTGVVRHRARQPDRGARLTFMPYVMQAAVAALQATPAVNATWQAEGILLHRHVHLGIAVAVPDGLVVPVIRHAERLDLPALAQALEALTAKAQARRLTAEDLTGGTFSLTNHGRHGSLAATPIIHQPQAAILGVGAIVKQPVVIGNGSLLPHADDAIVIRPMCWLSLSFDHRLLDGAAADAFLTRVRDALEAWNEREA